MEPEQQSAQTWLAVSLRRGNGRGVYTDDDFEIVKQEPEIIFSQLELLRERLILHQNKARLYSNGIAVQESDIEWEDNIAEWNMSSSDGEHDAWLSREDDSIHWESMIIEGGCFFTKAEAQYKEILPLRGIENPSIDIRLHTLADLPIDAADVPDALSLKEWTIDASAFRIFLERPEYEKMKKLDVSGMRTKGEELSATLQCGWHAKHLHELHIDQILNMHEECCAEMNELHTLSARDVGWTRFAAQPSIRTLNLRGNPLESLTISPNLTTFGVDTSIPDIQTCTNLQSLQVHTLHTDHLPTGLQHLSCRRMHGDIDWTQHPEIRSAQIPDGVGLPTNPFLQSLHIHGGSWNKARVNQLRTRFPKLQSLRLSNAHVEPDALVDWGTLHTVGLSSCGLENLVFPQHCQWKNLDLSNNLQLRLDNLSALSHILQLNIAHTNISMGSIIFDGSLMDLHTLLANGIRDLEACYNANALVSLQNLSVRGAAIPVLNFLSEQAFVSLRALDMGENLLAHKMEKTSVMTPRLRISPHHPQEEEIRWMWRERGHADIVHDNPLF